MPKSARSKAAGFAFHGTPGADIFWVFATPVMVSVAKNFDAPIKLLFPRPLDALGRCWCRGPPLSFQHGRCRRP